MPLVIKKCKMCDREFKAKHSPSRVGRGQYCSRRCVNKSQEKQVKFNCEICNKECSASVKRSAKRFCSRKCHASQPVRTTTKNCEYCKKEMVLTVQKKKVRFCSRNCAGRFLKPIIFETRFCLQCSKSFQTKPAKKTKFCSLKCSATFRMAKKITQVKKTCEVCSQEYSVCKYLSKSSRFCSKPCQYTFIRRGKITKNCPTCGKSFLTTKSTNQIHCRAECFYETFFPNSKATCLDCKRTLPKEQFSKNYKKGRGKQLTCKPCRSIRWRHARMKRKNIDGVYTFQQWNGKLEYFGHCCYLCKESLEGKTVHKEHRIPISRGGLNWIANIAPACARCNRSKHDLTEREFRESERFVLS